MPVRAQSGKIRIMKKAGTVALVGRPNSGKSTLLNALVGHKVAITSPKPQTTRFVIEALYENERGQIVFMDTPGIFAKVRDPLAAKINLTAEEVLAKSVDVIVYLIDHTRYRDVEENRIIGLLRKVNIPKILVFNKMDVKKPTFIVQYAFLREEFDKVVEISALTHHNLNLLIDDIFEFLPQGAPFAVREDMPSPALNLNSKTYIAELIREKAFLSLRKEVPYSLTTEVREIAERKNGDLYIKGAIITSSERYRGMIIGSGGKMIKEIGTQLRKELEVVSGKKVFVDLTVEVDPHWVERV